MILFIDNYDSFTYNLVQFCGSVNPDVKVVRNDEITVEEIEKLNPSHIILSPGPGYPKNAGVCEEVIEKLKGKYPILGVCLGHQAICEVFGAEIVHAKKLMHGKKKRYLCRYRLQNLSRSAQDGAGRKIPLAYCRRGHNSRRVNRYGKRRNRRGYGGKAQRL